MNTRTPDVVAPGHSILSLYDPGSNQDGEILADCANAHAAGQAWTQPVTGDQRFVRGSGTSQSAAMVSGAVALMLSKDPSLTPDQVKFLLRGTAIPIPGASGKDNTGQGKVNLSGPVNREGKSPMAQKLSAVTGGNGLDDARGYDPVTGNTNTLEAVDRTMELVPGACALADDADAKPTTCVPLALRGNASIGGETFDLKQLRGAESVGQGQAWCSRAWNGWNMCLDNVNVGSPLPPLGATETWRGGTFRVGTKFDNVKLLGAQQAERQLVLQSAPWTTAADWAGHAWTPHDWGANRWSANRWSADRWADQSWLAANFDANPWSANRWSGSRWVGNRWMSSGWVDFAWS